jgi:predicted nuclease of predicted toxin-antitoxin system
MIFLIDECLHPSLVKVAEERGHQAHYLVYLGMQGWKDPDVLSRVAERDYTLVTNNAADFRRLYAGLDLHAGLIIVVPNVKPNMQQALFRAVLDHLGARALVNTVVEVEFEDDRIAIIEYYLPDEK